MLDFDGQRVDKVLAVALAMADAVPAAPNPGRRQMEGMRRYWFLIVLTLGAVGAVAYTMTQ
ncbi:hypothetical protein [Ancylobacter sp.]|uniref:hypothetical protein n=1 Tax=Ancylobacter sp. TaxID=1872567 RepID=UPI003D0CBB35